MTEQSTQQIQTTTEKVKKYLIGLFAVTLIFIGVTASFYHRLLPSKNYKMVELNKERSELKAYWNNVEVEHDKLLVNDEISIQNYLFIKSDNEKNRVLAFRGISKTRSKLAIDFSFNGRSSLNFWLWIFGLGITLLIASGFLATKDARLHEAGVLKWYEPTSSISFIAVALFWLYHTIFQTTRDFELQTYIIYLVIVIIPLSYFIYYFLRRFTSMVLLNKLKNTALMLDLKEKLDKAIEEAEKDLKTP